MFGALLANKIPVRGAIAHGTYVSEKTDSGRFVAGRAVIDAYQFEEKQDWIGIMVAPSVLGKVECLADYCALSALPDYTKGRRGNPMPWPAEAVSAYHGLKDRLAWAAHVQRCPIPFHGSVYEGYAIVPTIDKPDPINLAEDLKRSLLMLQRLKSLAPSPEIQSKYDRTITWLSQVRGKWDWIAARYRSL